MKIVLIDWVDSTFFSGWHKKNEVDTECSACQSVGFLVGESKDTIVLSQSESPENYGDSVIIPRVCIKKMKVLKS